MGRTPSQKRYSKKRLKTVPVGQLRAEEVAFLRRKKREMGLTWLALLYKGLGMRREDYLNSREFKDAVPSRPTESHELSHL